MRETFRFVSAKISSWAGSALAFVAALFIVLVWASTGPLFNFSDTWQLVVNTGTTIVTFLMVFLIQNTQNRDGRAMQLKLDELIRASKSARDSFVSLEDISDKELAEITNQFQKLHEHSAHTPAMRKLHQKIEHEHLMRQSLKNTAGRVAHAVLDPLGDDKR